MKVEAYLPYLKELAAHWEGTHTPDPGYSAHTGKGAEAYFQDYQRALGEPVEIKAGHSITGFFRRYFPQPREKRAFMAAYESLRRGERSDAASALHNLARSSPRFAAPWIWLSATTGDPSQRLDFLEQAIRLEPAHPLALDALALARGDVSIEVDRLAGGGQAEIVIARCPECGGGLRYEPGETMVSCAYCSYRFDHQEADMREADAPLINTLRLERQFQRRTWREGERTLHCQACGAALIHSHHLARQCAYCGSTNVLVRDETSEFVQPDGLLPFTLDRDEAARAIRSALRGNEGRVETLEGIYTPFWVFDGVVDKQIVFLRGNQVAATHFDREYEFDHLLFPGVDMPPPSLMDQLPPYGLDDLVAYGGRFLADWPAQLYTQDVEWVVEDAYDTMLALAAHESGPPVVTGVEAPANTKAAISFQVSKTTYQLALLPMWVASLQRAGKRRLALVNGQTGKVVFG
jgi:uncharacterized Zn finger protein (UPF0148 family)